MRYRALRWVERRILCSVDPLALGKSLDPSRMREILASEARIAGVTPINLRYQLTGNRSMASECIPARKKITWRIQAMRNHSD
jgi:hypothetical protein